MSNDMLLVLLLVLPMTRPALQTNLQARYFYCCKWFHKHYQKPRPWTLPWNASSLLVLFDLQS
ncbi:hypothetical protein M758_8G120100 [Ceratodon purpureus]|uniref:Secreted protein n=1 Tax=Ceratodon purpureus TaxID=3225 RepID=A0A8T0HCP8_CERPU|nr:hypothetical protein KC19_N047200 [Ceratodon purpureus]KAG0504394.1 hypothetical protein KC19_N036500 [Ceratodon purpureus]KAG0504398.1 hypothetical protein KC19_N036900 [Ceratodon purpureus]KAG0504410.1 hypothetical protein KC19_N034900 [Ceratodon purpureus]KAG0504414.1 hypothetical protein KC19_N035300 [Ceratodon purpureus]